MTWDELMSMVHCADWKKSSAGLSRMTQLMHLLGDPQKDMVFIHVAGTNGKGSACAMLSSILTKAGYRTGRYISPHLSRVNERISVNQEDISDEDLRNLALTLKPAIDLMDDKPTTFEIMTALGFLYFHRQKCDIVVLEVGLGGRLDATNVIARPAVSAIMNIGLEHTEVLGDTIEKIACEKAGIIKPGCDVVLYSQSQEVLQVVQKISEERHSSLYVTEPSLLKDVRAAAAPSEPDSPYDASSFLYGTVFQYRDRQNLKISLPGSYQVRNAMVVLDVIDRLTAQGYSISEEAVYTGLRDAVWPGRFEVISRSPLIILDGAHNPNGVEALAESVRQFLGNKKITFIMGVMADKDYSEMLHIMQDIPAVRFICVRPDSSRSLDEDILRDEIRRYFTYPVITFDTVQQGLDFAMQTAGNEKDPDAAIVVFGSLYQAGEVRDYFEPAKSI